MTLLSMHDVHKGFDGLAVLRGITYQVAPHDVVALHDVVVLIGSSGSGKSTLPGCINGLEAVDAGHNRLAGEDITARELLARFGLADKADEYPDRLSGGQQQRVAIVRALAMRPELMLFDEVASALDPQLVGEVLDVIRDLKQAGMTIVMATHEMQFAREVADQVCFVRESRIGEQGSAAQVLDDPRRPETIEFLRRVRSA